MMSATSIYVTKDYTDPKIRTVQPPVYAEPFASISVLVFCLRMRPLALRNDLFLAAQKRSLNNE